VTLVSRLQPIAFKIALGSTMKTLRPYLRFDGECERALAFYGEIFGGHVKFMMRVDEAPGGLPSALPAAERKRVLHAEFAAEGISFMAADCVPPATVSSGDVVSLNLIFASTAEQDRAWGRLSEGGRVTTPLQEMFWGARFGAVIDRFGVPWMLVCEARSEA
jgi:PhnB protein